jgi:hypothetical protein
MSELREKLSELEQQNLSSYKTADLLRMAYYLNRVGESLASATDIEPHVEGLADLDQALGDELGDIDAVLDRLETRVAKEIETRKLEPSKQLMSSEHALWKHFLDCVADGCNLDVTGGKLTWTCDSSESFSVARRTLADMGFSPDQVERSLESFREHGGFCDCEIVLNVGTSVKRGDDCI